MAEIDDALVVAGKYVATSLLGSVFIVRGLVKGGHMNPAYGRAILISLGAASESEAVAKNLNREAALLIAQRPHRRVKRRN